MNIEQLNEEIKLHKNKIVTYSILTALFIILIGIVVVGLIIKIIIPIALIIISNIFPELIEELYSLIEFNTDMTYDEIANIFSLSNITFFSIALAIIILFSFYLKFFVLINLVIVFAILLTLKITKFNKAKKLLKEINDSN